MQGVTFIRFPQPLKEPEKCKRWADSCGRENFTSQYVKNHTYICSKHFVGGNGPTEEHPDPIPLIQASTYLYITMIA